MSGADLKNIPYRQHAISILWPSFLTAIVASGLFFSIFDPQELVASNIDFEVSPLTAYSSGFFLFWALATLSSVGTLYFSISNYNFQFKHEE